MVSKQYLQKRSLHGCLPVITADVVDVVVEVNDDDDGAAAVAL